MILLGTRSRDFVMLIRVLSNIYAKWDMIGTCIRIKQNIMDDLERRWGKSKLATLVQLLVSQNYVSLVLLIYIT